MSCLSDGCQLVLTDKHRGVVAKAVAEAPDEPYRLAEKGEPIVVVEWEIYSCNNCGREVRRWTHAT